jgi:hypothetical protein
LRSVTVIKRMSRFQPTQLRPFADAEAHYIGIHHRFAREMFRHHAPAVLRYATARATARLDINGRFDQEPDVWRFIVLKYEDAGSEAGTAWLPPWAERTIVADHTNFLREVRPFLVEENVLIDRRSNQTSTHKYVIEFERDPAVDGGEVAARDELRELMLELADERFGLRLFVENRVVAEAEMAPVSEPGQAYSGRTLAATSMTHLDEWYFDHPAWGDEFFAMPQVTEALRHMAGYARIACHRVDELVGVDRG